MQPGIPLSIRDTGIVAGECPVAGFGGFSDLAGSGQDSGDLRKECVFGDLMIKLITPPGMPLTVALLVVYGAYAFLTESPEESRALKIAGTVAVGAVLTPPMGSGPATNLGSHDVRQ